MDAMSPAVPRHRFAVLLRPLFLGVLAVALWVPACLWADASRDTRPVYTLAVVPRHPATDLAARWTPLLRYLEGKTGLRLVFRTGRDVPTFELRAVQGEYDFVYLNPFQYTLFQQKVGYRALAREHARGLRGVVVVRADAPYRGLRDLKDHVLAFPAPSAFAASLVTRAQFRTQNIRIQPRFVVSHDSVYYGVANGLFAAGGGTLDTYQRLDPTVRAKLRVLWTSPEYVSHALASHPRLPHDIVMTVQRALRDAGRDPEGRRVLAAAGFETLGVAGDREYDPVRHLSPVMRAELCMLSETPAATRAWLCPTSLAGNVTRVRAREH
jgi:phosphonate transport system substrate-binding protein